MSISASNLPQSARNSRALLVCRQLQQHGGELTRLCDTKTDGSVHMIALDRLTVTVLRRHYATTAFEGPVGGFVFTNTRGDPITPDRLGEPGSPLAHGHARDTIQDHYGAALC